jgi:hypothetical protein
MSAASVASKSMNLGVSCLARAQNIQHQAARLNQDSEVMLPEWLDLAHRVAPALILKARECLTTALSIMAEKNGTIVNLELSCRLNLAFLAFGKGDENEALCHLCQLKAWRKRRELRRKIVLASPPVWVFLLLSLHRPSLKNPRVCADCDFYICGPHVAVLRLCAERICWPFFANQWSSTQLAAATQAPTRFLVRHP